MTFSDLALAAWACGEVIVWEFETFAFGGAVKGLGSQASMRLPLDAIVVLCCVVLCCVGWFGGVESWEVMVVCRSVEESWSQVWRCRSERGDDVWSDISKMEHEGRRSLYIRIHGRERICGL